MSNVQIPESIAKATATSLRAGIKSHLETNNIRRKLVKELYRDADALNGGIEAFVHDLKHGNKKLNRQPDLAELFCLLSIEANDLTARKEKATGGKGRIGGFAMVLIGLVKFGASHGQAAVTATEKLSWKGRKLTTVQGLAQLSVDLEAEIASSENPDVTFRHEVMLFAKQVINVETPEELLEDMCSRYSDYTTVCCGDINQRQFYADAHTNLLNIQKELEVDV